VALQHSHAFAHTQEDNFHRINLSMAAPYGQSFTSSVILHASNIKMALLYRVTACSIPSNESNKNTQQIFLSSETSLAFNYAKNTDLIYGRKLSFTR